MIQEVIRYRLESGPGVALKFFGGVIITGALFVFKASQIISLIFAVIGALPFLLYKCLEFDLYKGSYCMGLNFAGYTFGEKEPYPGVDYLFLKKNKTIHPSNRRNWSSTYSISYDGYILLSDGVKLLIVQEGIKEKAMKALQQVALDLQTEIRDLTGTTS